MGNKQISGLIEEMLLQATRSDSCCHVFIMWGAEEGVRAAVLTGEADQPREEP